MKSHVTTQEPEIETENEIETSFNDDSDICQQLMHRYSASKAVHHRHLIATAAAIRSILSTGSLPITSSAYFMAAIDNLSNFETLDSTAVAALLSFVSILVPLIPHKDMENEKASEAVKVLVAVVEREGLELGAASVSCVVKCLGILIVKFCDLKDWSSSKLGFETILKLCVDKRPKVRRAAQDFLEKVFKSTRSSSTVTKESSKLVLSLLKSNMPNAIALSELNIVHDSKDEAQSKPGNLEVLHMLNMLKLVVPSLSVKTTSKVMSELFKLIRPQFTHLTKHVFTIIGAFFESSKEEVIVLHLENIINSLCLYVSNGEKNPAYTVVSAATLLNIALDKLHAGGSRSSWTMNVPKVFGSIAGLLTYETITAPQASNIMKEMIKHCIDEKMLLTDESPSFEDASQEIQEVDMINSICAVFENTLSSCKGCPNEHLLGVISTLFLKLGEVSFIFMKNLVLKLSDLMNSMIKGKFCINHLSDCIGSAVVAMGPERILTLIPISLDADTFTCSNIWLVPILKKHVVGASLGCYMEHIVPLANSFMEASEKVKKSVIDKDLQAYAQGLWGLLPAFCQYPVDTHRQFSSLAALLTTFLKEYAFMHQNVAVALQALVNQNRSADIPKGTPDELHSDQVKDAFFEFRKTPTYSKKTASKNMKALSSCSTELLQALIDLFVDSPSEKRLYIKDAIGCLASITDSSTIKTILMSLLERFQLVNDKGEFEQRTHGDELIEVGQDSSSANEKYGKRCMIMELASSLVERAERDLINLIYNFAVCVLKDTAVGGHCAAFYTVSRILEEHAWFSSSQYMELIDLLTGLKPPTDVVSLRNRFACFRILMMQALEKNLDEEDTKAFLMLNEIILTLKDAKDEARKVAYDTLLLISSSSRNSATAGSGEPCHKLISMIMGYLSGPSPHIKSGAVSALSLLVYNDTDICLKMPDLVPSLLSLLQSKSVEVIKAVLGFVKVLVSSLHARDLQNLLSDITNGVLLWSTISRFHFKSKVTVILEIMTRKCGSAAVELVTPEKYKGFVKTVLENRHHKSASKQAGSADTETKPADPSSKRIVKRKHEELVSASEGKGSVHQKKRMRKNKERSNLPISAGPRKSSGDGDGPEDDKRKGHSGSKKPVKGQLADKGKKRKFIREPSGEVRNRMKQRNTGKKGETGSGKPASTSKFRKSGTFGKKRKS